jgi:hypothetical protein
MLHLCMSVYQSFVLFLSVYKSFFLYLAVSAYKSSVYVILYLEEHSLQKKLFVLFFSKQVFLFQLFPYVFEIPKQTEKQPNRL